MSHYSIRDINGLKNFYSEKLINAASSQLGISKVDATMLIHELTKYLAVVAAAQANNPAVHYSPPGNLDTMWHFWLQPENLPSYNEFCDKYLGRRVAHTPMPVQPRDNFETVARELGLTLDKVSWNSDDGDADCG